jgi:hypothetical protein
MVPEGMGDVDMDGMGPLQKTEKMRLGWELEEVVGLDLITTLPPPAEVLAELEETEAMDTLLLSFCLCKPKTTVPQTPLV